MSYARFGPNSDVYVYSDVSGYIACCGCLLGDREDFHSIPEIVTHMGDHAAAGHKVHPALLDPETFDGETFTAICRAYMCRKDEGHDGEHTPTDAQGQRIRDLDALDTETEGKKTGR